MLNILKHELAFRFRKLSTYLYFIMFLLTGFFLVLFMGGAFRGTEFHPGQAGAGSVHVNAPYVIHYLLTIVSSYGILLVSAFFGTAGFRDYKQNFYTVSYSYPMRKAGYLAGKFTAAFLSLLFIFSGLGLGILSALGTEYIDRTKVGAIKASAILWPYIFQVIPNLLYMGMFFFAAALLLRKIFPVYVGSIALLTAYLIGQGFSKSLSTVSLAGILDPFGKIAVERVFMYWTVAQKNSLLLPLKGVPAYNRIFWLGLGVITAVYLFRKFDFTYKGNVKGFFNRREKKSESVKLDLIHVKATRQSGFGAGVVTLTNVTKKHLSLILKNIYFVIILLLGVGFLVAKGIQRIGVFYGTETLPVTWQVLEVTSGVFFLFVAIVIIFFSGELVWLERDNKFSDIVDSTPVPSWALFGGKLAALILVQFVMMAFVLVSGILFQVFKGFYKIDLPLYLIELFGFRLTLLIFFSVMAFVIHVFLDRKILGHLVFVVYLVLEDLLPMLGLENRLLRFGHSIPYQYSEMNGYGPFLKPVIAYNFYWMFFAGLLLVVAYLFYSRGITFGKLERLKKAARRWRGKAVYVFTAFVLLWLATGGYIYYNTNILNAYETKQDEEGLRARYEREYRKYYNTVQPVVEVVKLDVDIFPEKKLVNSRGQMTLFNRSEKPLDTLFLQCNRDFNVLDLSPDVPHTTRVEDKDLSVFIFSIDTPLQPGESLKIDYHLKYEQRGFKHGEQNTRIVKNGTFLTSEHLAPSVGYYPGYELEDNDTRKMHGLPEHKGMSGKTDSRALRSNYIAGNSGWIDFEINISTSADQLAISAGKLVNSYEENGRRYFRYKPEGKILNFYPVISGRYEVEREVKDEKTFEVYYHHDHDYNIDRMLKAAVKSLGYMESNFGDYPFSVLRIVEFPRYSKFAQSFATVIPYSEGIGFIADIHEGNTDYIMDVTAHETSHQWWGNMLIGADVQGSTCLTEVPAQYCAYAVDTHSYNRKQLNSITGDELERYLKGRGALTVKENTLLCNENEGYLHYGKGLIVMNRLMRLLGEERLNEILKGYFNEYRFAGPPYPVSDSLFDYIINNTDSAYHKEIEEMFKGRVLFDMKIKSAHCSPSQGVYLLAVDYEISKFETDKEGNEIEQEVDLPVTFGVYDTEGAGLHEKMYRLSATRGRLEITLTKKPEEVVIDPYISLIDRNILDNACKVKMTR